ncbi:MAG: DUF2817 domain-containing protein [Gammaproteobacteria bacterium]|nr:DUF2817 domain-containing protein [Gammaproteobacteria bacterium]
MIIKKISSSVNHGLLALILVLTLPALATALASDDECKRISDKLASVTLEECLLSQLEQASAYSSVGSPILFKDYTPVEGRLPLGRVLLIGGIHGDEYSSVSIVFKWMNTLNEHHSGLFHWRILPLLNPDGLLAEKSQRMNSNNVDLNRNFPMQDWQNATRDYWENITKRNPRRFPGNYAVSESETQYLVDEIQRFQPDVIVAVHAPHGIVDYDGPKNGPYKLGRLYLNLLGTYPGSLGNYAGVQLEIPVVTIELPYAGIMPKPSEVAHIWRDLVGWLRKNIGANQETDPS